MRYAPIIKYDFQVIIYFTTFFFSSISNIIMQIPDDKVVHFVGVQDFIERHIIHKKRNGRRGKDFY
jgi:hypothetical protein